MSTEHCREGTAIIAGQSMQVAFSALLNHCLKEGKIAFSNADYLTALGEFESGLDLAQQIEEQQYIALFLNLIGNVYINIDEYQKALDTLKKALTITLQIGDQRTENAVLTNLGVAYKALGKYHLALEYLQKSLNLRRKREDKYGEGLDILNLGATYNGLNQPQKALDFYQQSLKINREIKDKKGERDNLGNIGNLYRELRQYQQASEYIQQSLTIGFELDDRQGIEIDLSNLGLLYEQMGQYQTALYYYQKSLDISLEINGQNQMNRSNTLGMIGAIYGKLGEYQISLEYFQQALEIESQIGDQRGESITLGDFGITYHKLGQHQKALTYYQKALVIAKNVGDIRGEAMQLNNIGLYYLSEQTQKALSYFQKAQKALTTNNEDDNCLEGAILVNIGLAYDYLGQSQKALALDYFYKGLDIKSEFCHPIELAEDYLSIGNLYFHVNDYERAKQIFQHAITLERLDSYFLSRAQRSLALTEIELNQFDAAIQHYKQSIDNIENVRSKLTKKEYKISFMQNKLYVYEEFIALLQSLHSNHPDKKYDRKALETFERKQGRVFLEEMSLSGIQRFSGLPENMIKKEQSLKYQLEKIQADLWQLRNQSFEPQATIRINSLTQQFEILKNEQAQFEVRLQKEYPKYYALKYPKPVKLATLQNQVLQEGEMMLVYGVMEDSTILWIIGKDQFQMLPLSLKEDELIQQVNTFRTTVLSIYKVIQNAGKIGYTKTEFVELLETKVEDSLPNFLEISHRLYQNLLPAKARQLLKKAQLVYVVPTGALYGLPFEALVTNIDEEKETPHYLIQDVAIAILNDL